jgi:hypothetical protein
MLDIFEFNDVLIVEERKEWKSFLVKALYIFFVEVEIRVLNGKDFWYGIEEFTHFRCLNSGRITANNGDIHSLCGGETHLSISETCK